jgi:biopolymer transport protein ExbD
VMNLFLFFFITFTISSAFQMKRESPLKVALPTIQKSPAANPVFAHEIFLTKSGGILWDQTTVTVEGLKTKLQNESDKSKPVSLRADREASVQGLVSLFEAIRDSGATNVALQTKLESNLKKTV